jgi:hypothetical protein
MVLEDQVRSSARRSSASSARPATYRYGCALGVGCLLTAAALITLADFVRT